MTIQEVICPKCAGRIEINVPPPPKKEFLGAETAEMKTPCRHCGTKIIASVNREGVLHVRVAFWQ